MLFALALGFGYVGFKTGIDYSANWIWNRPEYSHGLIIPFISAFLVWQQRDSLERLPFQPSWGGVALLVLGALLSMVGKLASLFIVEQYAVVIAFCGLVLALVGWQVFRRLWVPLLLLFFMVPLPEFLFQNLSAKLQLISSQIGVWVIRLFGISVYLEGNVIDLGAMQLQVAEACSGLRYLFPLMTLGFIMAYFFHAAWWKRALLFVSSIPVTILMNSFRIGMIGVLVEYWGIGMAEGFLHDFEGWVVFMASTGVLVLEVIVLSWIGIDHRPWREVFGLDFPPPTPATATIKDQPIPISFTAACVALMLVALVTHLMPERRETIPVRSELIDFPLSFDSWSGRRDSLDRVYLDQLKLDDYLMANYRSSSSRPVNFYVAWYDTQRAGRSTHSPRACLPSGGWEVESLSQKDLSVAGDILRVNRALIRLGSNRQLVYYYFKQRQRIVTNEYLVKWYLFWDSLTQNRTDGALVRYTIALTDADSIDDVEAKLVQFVAATSPLLTSYVPD